MYPGIGHQKLADVVKDALAARGAPGINIIAALSPTLLQKPENCAVMAICKAFNTSFRGLTCDTLSRGGVCYRH